MTKRRSITEKPVRKPAKTETVYLIHTPNVEYTGRVYGILFQEGRAVVRDPLLARRFEWDMGYKVTKRVRELDSFEDLPAEDVTGLLADEELEVQEAV